MLTAPEALFLAGSARAGGQRLALHHRAQGAPRGAVLQVHAFAEEMNKSRRMAALGARAMAAAGYEVLQIDLFGCGDSSGEFGQATWSHWLDDVVHAAAWLQQRQAGPLWLWGQRAGCLLAAEAAQLVPGPCHFVFWQPAPKGQALLQQFLRLKMAAALLDGNSQGVTESLKATLAAGESVEVAGYTLGAALAQGLGAARLTPPPAAPGAQLLWLELSAREPLALLPASDAALATWRDAGYQVQALAVSGPAFWQTVEIEDAPALVEATLAGLRKASAAAP